MCAYPSVSHEHSVNNLDSHYAAYGLFSPFLIAMGKGDI